MRLFFNILKKKQEKKRILFAGISNTNFIQFRPVYKMLKTDPRIDVFFSGMYHGKDRPVQLYQPFDIKKKFIIREKRTRCRSFDMYISPDFHMVGKKHAATVQMFHTTSFRNFSIGERAKDFDHLFLIGPYMKSKFLESGVLEGREGCFEEVGMPQTDALVTEADPSLFEKLNLNRGLPVVLYAPVWAPIESFLKDVQRSLGALSKLNVNLLLKLHHAFYYKQRNSIEWLQYISSLLENNRNMRLIDALDIVPYMHISDLLVSDVSAVVHQFSILDKPIVCMKIDVEKFKEDWPNLDEEAYARRAVIEADVGEALKEAVVQALANPAELSQQRLAMSREYFYNIGCSTKVAVDKIYQFLKLEQKNETKKTIQ